MQIELSEVLTCPECRSPQGLVVMVEELGEDGRVRAGDLGCSRCERRYPVRSGALDLARARGEERDAGEGAARESAGAADAGGAATGGDRPPPQELAAEVGALLDLREARGAVVLGHGLLPAAGRVAAISADLRVLALTDARPGDGAETFTVARVPAGRLPLLPGKVRGVALWRPSVETARHAREALAPGGRVALLRPPEGVRRELEDSDLEVLASEARAAVARLAG